MNSIDSPLGAYTPPKPTDPFGSFFHDDLIPRPEGLADITSARRWLEVIGWGLRSDLYTYQQPYGSRGGPRVELEGRGFIQASSYDYLGLIGHREIEAAALDAVRRFGTGTGGVRLLTGTNVLHRELEAEVARTKGTEAAAVFTSGYLATLGGIAALMGPRDRVVLDERAHRSIFDACRLAGVPHATFRHNDVASLERVLQSASTRGRTLVAVEGAYSMDGDVCPLPEIVEVKNRYSAYLMVDEAHSFGVYGASGRGIDEHFGVPTGEVDLWMGSLSKAIPSNGGFLAGRRDLIIYLQHAASPFFFSAALCPAATAAAHEALHVIARERWRIEAVHRNAVRLRSGLQELGFDTGASSGLIVPVIVGSDELAYRAARSLFDRGVIATAVVFPAVQPGSARLRLCATAAQSEREIGCILEAFRSMNQGDRWMAGPGGDGVSSSPRAWEVPLPVERGSHFSSGR
jgi:8-amino-7-oxononanoate synthase